MTNTKWLFGKVQQRHLNRLWGPSSTPQQCPVNPHKWRKHVRVTQAKQEATSSVTCSSDGQSDLCCVYLNQRTIFMSPWILKSFFPGRKVEENQQSHSWELRGSTATSGIVKTNKHFQNFRGHFNWGQLSLSVTWLLSPDGKHNLFKLPQRDLARWWVHSTHICTQIKD